jgi:hypothetical protein
MNGMRPENEKKKKAIKERTRQRESAGGGGHTGVGGEGEASDEAGAVDLAVDAQHDLRELGRDLLRVLGHAGVHPDLGPQVN